MPTVDLLSAEDRFIIHYGGRLNEVNANTFANSLLAIGGVIEEINRQVNPEFAIEIKIEALGEGSFRPRLRLSAKKLRSLISDYVDKKQLIPILIAILTLWRTNGGSTTTITIEGDAVIYQTGDNKIILPRDVHERAQELQKDPIINRNLRQNFDTLDEDPSITDFGITEEALEDQYYVYVPRDDFDRLAHRELSQPPRQNERVKSERAIVKIIKAVYEVKRRKWEFVWKGFRISAYIDDPNFFNRLTSPDDGRLVFGFGDSLEVDLDIAQRYDEGAQVWINVSYSIVRFIRHIPRGNQPDLL